MSEPKAPGSVDPVTNGYLFLWLRLRGRRVAHAARHREKASITMLCGKRYASDRLDELTEDQRSDYEGTPSCGICNAALHGQPTAAALKRHGVQ